MAWRLHLRNQELKKGIGTYSFMAAISRFRRDRVRPSARFASAARRPAFSAPADSIRAAVKYTAPVPANHQKAAAIYNLAVRLRAQGRISEALTQYKRVLEIEQNHASAHTDLAIIYHDQANLDDALAHYRMALASDPNLTAALNNLGNIFKSKGMLEDALGFYERAVRSAPDCAVAHYNRAEVLTFRSGAPELAELEALANRNDLDGERKAYIHFALGKALEDTGDYARAFEQLRRGNALKRRQTPYDENEIVESFRKITASFDGPLFKRLQGQGCASQAPVFVLGMPRSGSTLVAQILAGHPQIHSAGELPGIDRVIAALTGQLGRSAYPEAVGKLSPAGLRQLGEAYVADLPRRDGCVRIIDKLPGNFRHIGLIRLILPNAKIIHTSRNPFDTCVSCYSKLFSSGQHFSYDLAELGRYYRRYQKLMRHWRAVLPPGSFLDVAYEDVVNDVGGQARRLVEFCGLDWDARCTSFHKNDGFVMTASAVQVRKPLYRDSLNRWRRYEAWLSPLFAALGEDRMSAAA